MGGGKAMSGEAGGVAKRFEGMCEELREWRRLHPEATMDEIAAEMAPRRRALMGELLLELAVQHGDGYELEGIKCGTCGEPMVYKGKPEREVVQVEGEGELKRAYYHCSRCGAGFSPPG